MLLHPRSANSGVVHLIPLKAQRLKVVPSAKTADLKSNLLHRWPKPMRRLVAKIFLPPLAFWVCPLIGFAHSVQGRVADPQGRAIAGAHVVLDCGGPVLRTRSKGDGQFVFAGVRASNPCRLTADYSHFKTLQVKIRVNEKLHLLQLKLAPVKQAVTVRARSVGNKRSSGRFDGPGSVSFSSPQLRKISNNTAQLIAYAKLAAGAGSGPDNIYVDGLPARVLPPAEMISRITVNADPFSAEYSDGDANHIEIITGSADRKLHFSLGGGSLGFGGGSPLASGLHSSSHHFSPALSGPVPHLPLTFSFEGNFGSNWSQQLVQAVVPEGNVAHTTSSIAPNGNSTDSASLNLYYSKAKATRAGLAYSQSTNRGWNSGVGGLTATDAASATAFGSREVRTFWEKTGQRWLWETGFVLDSTSARLWANSTDQAVNVPGYFQAGGSPISGSNSSSGYWTWKTEFQSNSQKRFWTWGLAVSRSSTTDDEVPNPSGELIFQNLSDYVAAANGAGAGTLITTVGQGHVRHATIIAAPFVQTEIWRSGHSILRGGIRGDYQSGGGFILSPRLSFVSVFHGFALRSGAGLFVHPWPNSALVHVLLDDGTHLQQFISSGATCLPGGVCGPDAAVPVVAAISSNFVRPRNLMLKESVERTVGNLSTGIEYTWVDGTHLLGSRRIPTTSGWTDLLESNRLLRKQEFHVRVQYRWKGQRFIGNYEWIRSRDNTDGPFSFPEFQDNLRADWARSTGVPAHTASLVGNFALPGKVSLTLLGSWHSSIPYTILTGHDLNNNGLFNDRGGLPRNSGDGPSYRSVSIYAYRHFSLGKIMPPRESAFGFDAGVQADDILGNRNYLSYGTVLGSPLFGKPLAALPGRSLRLWFEFTP